MKNPPDYVPGHGLLRGKTVLVTAAAGAGIGFVPDYVLANTPELHEVLPPRPEWATDFFLVTHVDLHRSAKVQALLAHLKTSSKTWGLA